MIYVASSWKNAHQPTVVKALKHAGLKVYDFREPTPGVTGFSWSQIDPLWEQWAPEQWFAALKHPLAVEGFKRDHLALLECTCCLLVLPCGRSAHLELGYAVGLGVSTAVLCLEPTTPDLMVSLCDRLFTSIPETIKWCVDSETMAQAEADEKAKQSPHNPHNHHETLAQAQRGEFLVDEQNESRFGVELCIRREALKMTQEDLSFASTVSKGCVAEFEWGKTSPRLSSVLKLLKPLRGTMSIRWGG